MRGSGNRPGRCSAPKWRRRRSGCRAPAPPRRPPPGRCSRAFAAFPCLAGVRDPAALADLPEPERQAWQAFWQEVEELLKHSEPAR